MDLSGANVEVDVIECTHTRELDGQMLDLQDRLSFGGGGRHRGGGHLRTPTRAAIQSNPPRESTTTGLAGTSSGPADRSAS